MYNEQTNALREKLTLLYALENLGNCTETQLLRFFNANDLMETFQFYIALADLKEAGLVEENACPEGKLLTVTDEGKNSLSMFAEQVGKVAKVRIRDLAPQWKRQIRDELQMPTDWYEENGSYISVLKVLESGQEIFHLKLVAADKQQAIDFCNQWPRQASYLYRTILERLGEPESNEETKTL